MIFQALKCVYPFLNQNTLSMEQSLLEAIVALLARKFPTFYVTRMLIIYSQDPATGSCPELDESIPHPYSIS
jgi:hypothetical protein